MKVLVIEDEPKVAESIRQALVECGFVVDLAFDGDDGLHAARTGSYDLIVLDVMLPSRDGWSVLGELRRAGASLPIIMLTARDSVQDRVRGLEHGADDYLVKPFAFSELIARVRTILRRGPQRASELLRVADLELDLLAHRATRAGQRLALTAKEFALLSLLARRAGEAVPRSRISEEVWDMNFDCDSNVLEVHVRRLRAKVDDPFDKKLIHTVRGIGYALEDRS